MSFLVTNCFHWIGFHIVNGLLEVGHKVDGIELDDSSSTADHLSMFVGRNSSFSLITKSNKQYDTTIYVGDYPYMDQIQTKKSFGINCKINNREMISTTIEAPLLFGEWMPMNKNGVFLYKKHIPFQSEFFQTNAIYIKDFVKTLIQWIPLSYLPPTLELKTSKDNRHEKNLLENTVYLHDNIPIESKIKIVLAHYERFKPFYDLY